MAIRVLIVDDSAFVRQTLTNRLQIDPDISVVGAACDGVEALSQIKALHPDVVVLDVEMPRMDGLTVLKQIMIEAPTPVIMLSALTHQGTSTTIRALMRGAVDFVPKPDASMNLRDVLEELILKIKTAVNTNQQTLSVVNTPPLSRTSRSTLRPLQKKDTLIIIGASTGGPRALRLLVPQLPPDLTATALIVQHMPAGFTRSLAQGLHDRSSWTVQQAADGDYLARGMALLAPGNAHLCVRGKLVRLDKGPPRNHVRPSIDMTMETAVTYHSPNIIGVVLTGMGMDGKDGARLIKNAGGTVIAEHESTSVIYGMPGSVVKAGLADYILPINEIASALTELVTNE